MNKHTFIPASKEHLSQYIFQTLELYAFRVIFQNKELLFSENFTQAKLLPGFKTSLFAEKILDKLSFIERLVYKGYINSIIIDTLNFHISNLFQVFDEIRYLAFIYDKSDFGHVEKIAGGSGYYSINGLEGLLEMNTEEIIERHNALFPNSNFSMISNFDAAITTYYKRILNSWIRESAFY
jgi:hypothetical protein